METWELNNPEQWNVWKFGNGTVPHNEKYGNLGMKRSPTMKKMGYGNGTSPNYGKNGIREWNGPAQWKIWKFGMEWSRTMENMEIGNGTVPHNGMYGNLGREWSRKMKNMGYGNGTSPNNGKNGIREWKDPEQWKEWDTGTERSGTIENVENIG